MYSTDFLELIRNLEKYIHVFLSTPLFSIFTSLLIGVTGSGLTLWVTGYRHQKYERAKKNAALELILLEVKFNLEEVEDLKDELDKFNKFKEEEAKEKKKLTIGYSRNYSQLHVMPRRHKETSKDVNDKNEHSNSYAELDPKEPQLKAQDNLTKSNKKEQDLMAEERQNNLTESIPKSLREVFMHKNPTFQNKAYSWGMPMLYGTVEKGRLSNLFRFYSLVDNISAFPRKPSESDYDAHKAEELELSTELNSLLEKTLEIGRRLTIDDR